ncbi:MAG: hypothetical protein KF777_02155 [Planctomycetaceae bacterium]|nr:hypothetical protein [Planctomycetaceae bacterium]
MTTLSALLIDTLVLAQAPGAPPNNVQFAPSSAWMIDAGVFVLLAAGAVFAVCKGSARN